MDRIGLALEYHDALVKRWGSKATFRSQSPKRRFCIASFLDESERDAPAVVAKRIASCETNFISTDMEKLLFAAARSMPYQQLLPIDPPSSDGLVVLETPLTIKGLRGNARAWSWHACDRGVLSLYHSETDTYFMRAAFPGKTIPGIPYTSGSKILGNTLHKAFWALVQQRLVQTRDERPSRSFRRRIERSCNLGHSHVKCVILRRTTSRPSDGETDIEWSHRWLVSGHWRNQWLPSAETHRLQYIVPYVKGPEDKPLILKRTLNLVVR